MRTIAVSEDAFATVQLLAKAWGTSEDGVIRRLIDEYRPHETDANDPDARPIHAVYAGNRIEGTYDRTTRKVIITSGPLAGQGFKTPSGAAIAVIRTYRPDINPNRNGWTFWTLTEEGTLLQSIRGHG